MSISAGIKNVFYYIAGLGFLFLAKIKHVLYGYTSPKPYKIDQYDRCIDYDLAVVDTWLRYLHCYVGSDNAIHGKTVLELGPGSDLGAGLYLLHKGAANYNAIDVNNLVSSVPQRFYDLLFARLDSSGNDVSMLREELEKLQSGKCGKLNYVCRTDFNIGSALDRESIDIVFSQAALEHFDDIDETVKQLSPVVKHGAVLIATIDLKTHSRWIREKDPNNIYRYGQHIYNLFAFRGIPNRVRPFEYKELFERHGWVNVTITPISKLNLTNKLTYNQSFRDERSQMEYLSVLLCATRK